MPVFAWTVASAATEFHEGEENDGWVLCMCLHCALRTVLTIPNMICRYKEVGGATEEGKKAELPEGHEDLAAHHRITEVCPRGDYCPHGRH